MNILRYFDDSRKSVLCFNEGSRYLVPSKPLKYGSTSEILDIYRSLGNHDLVEVDEPVDWDIPMPFERLFLPAVNFRSHSEESSFKSPDEPYFFLKFPSSLIAHNGTVKIPRGIEKADYEGEIGIVIGKRGKYISEDDAMDYVFGYVPVDDVSLRDYQFREQPRFGKNWVMGKQFDGALPAGPWVTPAEDTGDFRFGIRTEVNGEIRQDGSTDDMIFGPEELISYLSQTNELRPGDLISTGTPSGVGAYSGGRFLNEGDRVEISVSGVGTLRHYISFD